MSNTKQIDQSEIVEKNWSDSFDIDIIYNEYSGSFLINFNKNGKYIVSQKVTEAQAIGIARDLKLKISR